MIRGLLTSLVILVGTATASAQSLTIGTNPAGSLGHASGVAIGRLIKTKMHRGVNVVPYAGSTVYMSLINRGVVDLGFSNAVELAMAYKGSGVFKGHKNPNIRLIAVIYPQRISLAVANDSKYKSVSDLKGARIPSQFTSQAIIGVFQHALLANGGLSIKDMRGIPVSNYITGVKMLGKGQVDVSLIPPGTGASQQANADLADQGGLRFLSLDDSPEAVARMRKIVSVASIDVMKPAAGLPGILKPTNVLMHPYWLIGRASLKDDFVYRLVKTLAANKNLLVSSFAPFRGFKTERMYTKFEPVPYHPGAIRYYRKIGLVK